INIAVEKEGITSHEENISLQIYPNPNSGKCYAIINCNEAVNTDLQLLNTVGQVVYQSAANLTPGSNTIYIDARDLPAGVYTMSVKTSTLNISKSIIIE
ncbi:MAG TPA: T9SS type A sorting domain-containing protein, partial [Chitinophagales bacterium]|nr:T9SS type A sorting domain-containing protein [Chitinophagales bacterium]